MKPQQCTRPVASRAQVRSSLAESCVARRAAASAKEPGAASALALALTRSGWQLAEANERLRAIACLREARALTTP